MTVTPAATDDEIVVLEPEKRRLWMEKILDDGLGGPESAADRIIRMLGRGHPLGVSANAAGVETHHVREALKAGADATRRGFEGEELSRDDLVVAEFSRAITHAQAKDEIERAEALRHVGVAGRTKKTTTVHYVRDKNGRKRKSGETVKVEELPPDPAANLAALERLYGERWTRTEKTDVNVSGVLVHAAAEPEDLVAQVRARLAKDRELSDEADERKAIEATATEVPAS